MPASRIVPETWQSVHEDIREGTCRSDRINSGTYRRVRGSWDGSCFLGQNPKRTVHEHGSKDNDCGQRFHFFLFSMRAPFLMVRFGNPNPVWNRAVTAWFGCQRRPQNQDQATRFNACRSSLDLSEQKYIKSHREFDKTLDLPEHSPVSGDRFQWEDSDGLPEFLVEDVVLAEHVDKTSILSYTYHQRGD